MKKFKLFCIKFALYVYTTYVYQDWSIYTKIGKIVMYPCWLYYAFFVWLVCPIFIPEYFFKQSELYKEIQRIQNSPEFKKRLSSMKFSW
jgi:hypothetical protein